MASESPARAVPRVVLAALVAVDVQLNTASALVEGLATQADDVERVHHRCGSKGLLGRGGLEAGEPIHRDDIQARAPGRLAALGQDRVVRGVPGHDEALSDPGHGQVLNHDRHHPSSDGSTRSMAHQGALTALPGIHSPKAGLISEHSTPVEDTAGTSATEARNLGVISTARQ